MSISDSALLAFEAQWWQHAGRKEKAIRDQLGVTPTAYYQQLNAVIDTAEAMELDAPTTRRLRSVRDQAQVRRAR